MTSASPAKAAPPPYVRTTASTGSAERAELDAAYKAYIATIDPLYDQKHDLTTEIEKTKRTTKKFEKLQSKLDALTQKISDLEFSFRPTKDIFRRAKLEDLAESELPESRFAAFMELRVRSDENGSIYDQFVALATEECNRQGVPASEARSVSLDAVSMISSYPGTRTLADQIATSWRVRQLNFARARGRDAVVAMELPDHKRTLYLGEIERSYSDEEINGFVGEAQKIHNEIVSEQRRVDEYLLRAVTPAGVTNECLTAHMNKTWDPIKKQNICISFEDAKASLKRLLKGGALLMDRSGPVPLVRLPALPASPTKKET